MAALVLGLAASALGPSLAGAAATAATIATVTSVAGAVGGLVGGLLDSTIIMPALFPQPSVKGQRIGELRIQHQEEGAPGNRALGDQAPTAGTILWLSELHEQEIEQEEGGKGGGGGSTVVGYSYSTDLAICFAIQRGVTITKILAEGQLVYDAQPDVLITSSLLEISKPTTKTMRVYTADVSIDLSKFRSGKPVTVSGASNGANNGTFECKGSARNPEGSSYVDLRNQPGVAETAGASITLQQDLPNFEPSMVSSVTLYDGDQISPDTLIESYEGLNETPAFVGKAYVVLERFQLGSFGNRVPNFFAVLSTGINTTGAAIQQIFEWAGRQASDCDVSRVTGDLEGYTIPGPQSLAQALQPIFLRSDLLAQVTTGGKIAFFPRSSARIIDIDVSDLCGESRPIHVRDPEDSSLPGRLAVTFLDEDAGYRDGQQLERKRVLVSDGTLTTDIPMVMTGAQARGVARRLLYQAWSKRETVNLSLPSRWSHLQENDIIRVVTLGETWFVIIQRMDLGHTGVCEIEATVELLPVVTQIEEAELPDGFEETGLDVPESLEVEILEPPRVPPTVPGVPIVPHNPRVMAAVMLPNPQANWRGAQLYREFEDDWTAVDFVRYEATMGYTTSALAAGVHGRWDESATVDVELYGGALSTRSEIDVLNGANRIMIGTEVIAFRSATLLAESKFRISGLLRGLRGTPTTGQASDVRAIVLRQNAGEIFELSLTDLGRTINFRVTAPGESVLDATTIPVTISGSSMKPLSPCDIQGLRDTDGNLTITWARRTRAITRLFTVAPLGETTESYSIEFWRAGDVVRTVSATSRTVSYTAAQQVTDGFTAFDAVEVRIYQIGEVIGRGDAGVRVV